jgi:ComF family protein
MHFDRAASAGVYSGALAASIIRLKEVPVICRQVREVLINTSSRSDLRPDVLIPVPLSSRRRLERGFNQAEILADALARFSKISMDPLSLERTVHTQTHRVAMDHKARAASVKNAFRVTRPHLIEGRNVLLIDDLLTSGATASICAEVLKNAGAATVNVLTLARAARRT